MASNRRQRVICGAPVLHETSTRRVSMLTGVLEVQRGPPVHPSRLLEVAEEVCLAEAAAAC